MYCELPYEFVILKVSFKPVVLRGGFFLELLIGSKLNKFSNKFNTFLCKKYF